MLGFILNHVSEIIYEFLCILCNDIIVVTKEYKYKY